MNNNILRNTVLVIVALAAISLARNFSGAATTTSTAPARHYYLTKVTFNGNQALKACCRVITSPRRPNFPIPALLPTTQPSVDHKPMTERGRLQWLSAGCVQVMLQIPAQQIREARVIYQRIATCGRAHLGAMTGRWRDSGLELQESKPLISVHVTTAGDITSAFGA